MAYERVSSGRRPVRVAALHLLGGAALTALWMAAAPALAWAEDAPQLAQATQKTFAIPPQLLSSALTSFGRQAGVQLSVDPDLVAGRTSAGLSGAMSPAEALSRLLTDTGLTFRFTAPDTVVLLRAAGSADGALQLGPITVEGSAAAPAETAWGPVSGYVATRSAAGSKTDTALAETPQSVSVIGRQEMTDRNVQTVTDALRYVPGVFTQPHGEDGRYDRLSIRGFDSYQQGDYRDGLRQMGNNFVLFRTEPYGLERIDVLRGPSSVLFGQNSPGGVVNRISKMPTADAVREVELQGGTFNRMQGAFDFGGAATKDGTILYRVVGLARDSDTQFEFNSKDSVADDRRYFAPALTWKPNADTSVTLLAQYLEDHAGIGRVYTDAQGNATHVLVGDPDYNTFDQTQTTAGAMVEHRFNDALTARSNVRFGRVDVEYRFLDQRSAVVGTSLPRYASSIKEGQDSFATDNQLEGRLVTGPLRHTLLGGLDYQRNSWSGDEWRGLAPNLNLASPSYGGLSISPLSIHATDSHQVVDQIGVYGQDQIKLGDEWVLTAGGRQDWADTTTDNHLTAKSTKTSDDAFSGRLGLTYLSPIGLAPYVSYSESFMPVTGTDARGNPFKPTTANQYEGGIKFQPKGSDAFITASVFELTQQNVSTTDPSNTSYKVQTGEVRSRGFELEGKANLAPGLGLIASYTHQDVEVTKSNDGNVGKRPTVVPDQMASLWLDYTLQSGSAEGLGFGSGVRYTGDTAANATNTQENPSSTLFDAEVHYDLDGIRLALNATNLFDKQVAICDSGSCYWGSERTVIGSVRYRW